MLAHFVGVPSAGVYTGAYESGADQKPGTYRCDVLTGNHTVGFARYGVVKWQAVPRSSGPRFVGATTRVTPTPTASG